MTPDNTTPVSGTIFRPRVEGKFIFVGDEKLYIRGVSYGGFRPDEDGFEFPDQEVIKRDFALMQANGINAIRVYTTPPRSILNIAHQYGLYVMVGLTAEQFVGALIDKKYKLDFEEVVRSRVRDCAGHPAVLCYAIANEIPASIVRWLGPRWVERYLERLYWIIKTEDPKGLITYTNYPSTEYLQLPFLDFISFNVYLESQKQFDAYLPRLHNIAGNRPLIMSELGLDSLRHGEDKQATVLDWQVRFSFDSGCAGVFIFTWTDEWHRGGLDVSDWAFGITDRERQPKPALDVVRDNFAEVPFPSDISWPNVSVIVCTYNGETHIRECCEGLKKLEYPDYEVIVVNDGSTDMTPKIVSEYGFRMISTENRGLSNARNTGLKAANGEIVAYIDDDAYPDQHWLTYIAATFLNKEYAGVGGPNLPPPGISTISNCIALAPGNPTHVLLSDEEAEHIPGCNMAYRKDQLESIGGFDDQFRTAGDDVDLCWRLQQQNLSLGFSPAAIVWHYPRQTIRAFWNQQMGYGKAEGLLERKWPSKHNATGHWLWSGKIYNLTNSHTSHLRGSKIYFGTWGTAAFQSIYEISPGTILSRVLMPEWYLIIFFLLGFSALGIIWKPMLFTIPVLILSVVLPISQAVMNAMKLTSPMKPNSQIKWLKSIIFTTFLHLLQPFARLLGRIHSNLTPWRTLRMKQFIFPIWNTSSFWSEHWQTPENRLKKIEATLRDHRIAFSRGDDYARWDLEIRGGLFGVVQTCMAVEDQKMGAQLVRFRTWPRTEGFAAFLSVLFVLLIILAAVDQAWSVSIVLGIIAAALVVRIIWDCSAALVSFLSAIDHSMSDSEKWSQ